MICVQQVPEGVFCVERSAHCYRLLSPCATKKESLVYTRGRLVPRQSWTSSLHHVLKIFCVELSDLVTSGDLALLALSSCTLPAGQNAHSCLGMKYFPSLAGLFFFCFTNNGEVYGYQSIVVRIRENTSSRDELPLKRS